MSINWRGPVHIHAQQWRCAYCDRDVASNWGWSGRELMGDPEGDPDALYYDYYYVPICPQCSLPTFLFPRADIVAARSDDALEHLPNDVAALYYEARACTTVNAHTGAMLLGRQLLMHIAVAQEAEPHKTFAYYVDYLSDRGVVSAGMRDSVKEIRELGDETDHALVAASREQAEALLTFVAMLLKAVYE